MLYSWFHNESIRAYRWKKDKLIVEEVDSQNKRELDYSLQMVPADNMFSVVVYKQVADVFSEPQKKSTTVGLVTSGECFSVISEKNGFYQIITDSGKPFAKRDFERCWIRRADVRQFTDSDYRNEVYYCKKACFVQEAGEKSCYLRKYSYIYLKKTVL